MSLEAMEDSMEENMIYLDREQCTDFDLEYFQPARAGLRADKILASKSSGYDNYHWKLLSPYRSQVIVIQREEKDPPGWYHITT